MSTDVETRGKRISLKLFFAVACTAGMFSVSALAEAPMHGDGQRVGAAQDLGKVAQDVPAGLNIARSYQHNLDLRGTNIAVLHEGLSVVPKTLSELKPRWNRLNWRNDWTVSFRSGHPGLAVQVEVAA